MPCYTILCYAMQCYGLNSQYHEAIQPESVQERPRNDVLHKASKQAQRNEVFFLLNVERKLTKGN